MAKFYTVWSGREVGVFDNWKECKESVHGFSGAKYKSFTTKVLAIEAFSSVVEKNEICLKTSNPTKKDIENGDYIIPDHDEFVNNGDVVIYTDGSLLQGRVNNMSGTIGGYGAWLLHKAGEKEISGAFRNTTVSRMELMACIKALEIITKKCKVHIFSDSSYVVNTINLNWKRKKNNDLWNQLDSLMSHHDVSMHWVSGHSGLEGNERADILATTASNYVRNNKIHDHPEDILHNIEKDSQKPMLFIR